MSDKNRFKRMFQGPPLIDEDDPPTPAASASELPAPVLPAVPEVISKPAAKPAPPPVRTSKPRTSRPKSLPTPSPIVAPTTAPLPSAAMPSRIRQRSFSEKATHYAASDPTAVTQLPRHLRPQHASVTAILPKNLLRLARFYLPDGYTLPDLFEELLAQWVDQQQQSSS